MAKQIEKKTAEEKAPKVKRLNWRQVANQVVAGVSGKTSLGELAKEANDLFVEHGGKSKISSATSAVRRALETAEAVGVLKLTRPTDILVEKSK